MSRANNTFKITLSLAYPVCNEPNATYARRLIICLLYFVKRALKGKTVCHIYRLNRKRASSKPVVCL